MSNYLKSLCATSSNNYTQISQFGDVSSVNGEESRLQDSAHPAVRWTSPEAVLSSRYSTSSDVWSYGMVLFEIWSLGHKPFEDIPNQKVYTTYTPCLHTYLHAFGTHNINTKGSIDTVLVQCIVEMNVHICSFVCT